MTSALLGVTFQMDPEGPPLQLSWTAPGTNDAFLVLDWNGNGVVDNGSELFGNFTPQPPPTTDEQRNGFRALAQYDSVDQGGNNNGKVDSGDAIYNRLRLWFDKNHDAISQPDELRSLAEFGIAWISLQYKDSGYTDQYGNVFRYRALVSRPQHQQDTSFAYDVFLTVQ